VEFPIHASSTSSRSPRRRSSALAEDHKQAGLTVNTCEKVETIQKDADGAFVIETNKGRYRAWTVILALGRRGTPRKLGVPGEELSKVMYGLIEAEAYTDAHILVVAAATARSRRPSSRVPARQHRHALVPARGIQPHQGAQCAAHRGRRQTREAAGGLQLATRRDLPKAVRLDVAGTTQEIPNDYVWSRRRHAAE